MKMQGLPYHGHYHKKTIPLLNLLKTDPSTLFKEKGIKQTSYLHTITYKSTLLLFDKKTAITIHIY